MTRPFKFKLIPIPVSKTTTLHSILFCWGMTNLCEAHYVKYLLDQS